MRHRPTATNRSNVRDRGTITTSECKRFLIRSLIVRQGDATSAGVRRALDVDALHAPATTIDRAEHFAAFAARRGEEGVATARRRNYARRLCTGRRAGGGAGAGQAVPSARRALQAVGARRARKEPKSQWGIRDVQSARTADEDLKAS
uniref:Uncharacterized protein n=1 Tax=Mycena chlorophos TaxID=658473 RepID=A0ABQ0LDJ1_MYCCL|nr:predicted protein [Mycena chlorophos]